MTTWDPALDDYDDEYDDDYGDDACYWCDGEGWDECDDPIGCTKEHRDIVADGEWGGQLCRCSSCGGSGRAKDMTIW